MKTTFEGDRVAADGGGRCCSGARCSTRARFSASARKAMADGTTVITHNDDSSVADYPLRIVPGRRLARGREAEDRRERPHARGRQRPGRDAAGEAHLPLLHVALLVHEREGRRDRRVDLRHRHDHRPRQEGQGRDVDEGRRPRRLLAGCRTWRSSAPRRPARPCRSWASSSRSSASSPRPAAAARR